MKKRALFALVLLLSVSFIFAGGKKESAGPVTITFGLWDEVQKPVLQKVADQFNAAHPDIKVIIEQTPWDQYWTKLDAAAGAGQAPDLFWMNDFLPKYVDGGMILPLDKFIARDAIDMKKYVPAITSMYNYKGIQYGMPKGQDSVVVALNTGIFKKYGIALPAEGWTWADMRKKAAELKKAMADSGEYPILMELDAQPSHFNFAYQTGGFVINSDYTKSGYNLPATTKAYQNVVDLMKEGLMAPYIVLSETKGTDLFLSGKGAIAFVGSWKASVMENSDIGKAGTIKLITMPKQDVSNATAVAGLSYVIYKQSAHPEAAWEFVKFITGPVGNKIQAEAGIDIPALISAQPSYLGNFKNINVDAFFKSTENAFPWPSGPDGSLWYDMVEENVARIFAQEITAAEGTAIIYKNMQEILDR